MTGGAGYIGSHAVVEVMAHGHEVVIAGNLCNSKQSVVERIAAIAGRRPVFARIDLRDLAALRSLFATHAFDAVLHFAGLKAVGESVSRPLLYYDNNVCGTIVLVECMARSRVTTLVFSSTATV